MSASSSLEYGNCCEVVWKERVQDDASGLAAAAIGDLSRVQELYGFGITCLASKGGKRTLRWNPSLVTDRHGSTALMWAAGGGHVDVCDFLLSVCGVDVDQANKVGRTAFHWAVRGDRLDVCRWLVGRGANPGLKMKDGSSALDWAMFFGSLKTADWLVDELGCALEDTNDTECRPVHWAAAGGRLDALQWLHYRGADFGARNAHSHGCLNKACWKGHKAAALWLTTSPQGPQVLEQLHWLDLEGRTLVELTRMGGHCDLADILEAMVAASHTHAPMAIKHTVLAS